jgi:ParB/RepB/Spo0J family partition protein
MSIKKRFTIAKELASGIRSTVAAMANNPAQIHYDLMPLELIKPDPMNPRKLLLGAEDMVHGVSQSDPQSEAKLREFDKLSELAQSIQRVGVRNAIEVYKHEQHYQIISGERRYLASILAQETHIPVRISQKPEPFKLRYMQWVENINREDLSLYEKYTNLTTIAQAHQEAQGKPIDPGMLQNILGTSTPQAYRYYALLNADSLVMELVKNNQITNLKIIDELARLKDKTLRAQVIRRIQFSSEPVTSLSMFKRLLGQPQPQPQSYPMTGKPHMISPPPVMGLGQLPNVQVAQELLAIILCDVRLAKYKGDFAHINWDSVSMVNRAFQDVIDLLQKELVEVV